MKTTALSEALKNTRLKLHISQVEMAKHLHVTKSALCRYEKGNRGIPIQVVNRLKVLLGGNENQFLAELL